MMKATLANGTRATVTEYTIDSTARRAMAKCVDDAGTTHLVAVRTLRDLDGYVSWPGDSLTDDQDMLILVISNDGKVYHRLMELVSQGDVIQFRTWLQDYCRRNRDLRGGLFLDAALEEIMLYLLHHYESGLNAVLPVVTLSPDAAAVVDVLKRSQPQGTLLKLPSERLDRKLYDNVELALLSVGGKWSRKLQAWEFSGDAATAIAPLLRGELPPLGKEHLAKRRKEAFFPTPPALAERMAQVLAERLPGSGLVLEPSAGEGALLRPLRNLRDDLVAVVYELDPKRAASCAELADHLFAEDFLAAQPRQYEGIIANPPFHNGIEVKHVAKMLDELKPGGVMLCVLPATFKTKSGWYSSEAPATRRSAHAVLLARLAQIGARFLACPGELFEGTKVQVDVLVIGADLPDDYFHINN